MSNISVREFIERFDRGEFEDLSTSTQIDAGWYDWFCRDSSLRNKTRILGRKIKQLAESDKIDKDKMYVFFKNNCPMVGNLYDSFSFCDMESGDVQYWITPRSGFKRDEGKRAQVAAVCEWKEGVERKNAVEGSWKDVKEYFRV